MLFADDFYHHITMKDAVSKGERAEFLYDSFTYDTALPDTWVDETAQFMNVPSHEITSHFIWIYPAGDYVGQPAPLTLEGCRILSELEKGE